MANLELRPFWNRLFNFDHKLGICLIFFICVPRFLLVLNANETGSYGLIGFVMLVSAVTPFVFLSNLGREQIGMVRPKRYAHLFTAFMVGLALSLALQGLGKSLYGDTIQNWYNYISRSYKIPPQISTKQKGILFTVMAITGMTFSPIGEELFFRGIVHASFAKSIGGKKASLIDSSAFALIHISHFGLVFDRNNWMVLIVPGLIWVGAMFIVSRAFIIFKNKTGSLLGAVICHAAFNFGMIYSIFYLL